MSLVARSPERASEAPRDKPQVDRVEHANLERPGAQAHPLARGWSLAGDPILDWRQH
ncbi:MAG: hypothetical protein ABI919_03545 [Ramlibacter sp.]